MKITEELLVSLGFQKNEVSAEESGNNPYYYYGLDLFKNGKGVGYSGISLLSCSNDEISEEYGWVTEILEANMSVIKDSSLLTTFIMVCRDIENQ